MIKHIIIAVSLLALTVSTQAASFLDGLSLTTEGFYRADISNGGGEWGAGSTVGLKLNKFVTFNIRNLAYEHNNWGGSTIDESQAGVSAQILQSFNGKLTINAEGDYCRQWETHDNGIGVGGNVAWHFTKHIEAFGGVQYRVWNKGANDMMYPFGIKFSF